MNTEKRVGKVVRKSTGDIVKSSGTETATGTKNKDAQCLIKIIEQPTPVADEGVASLIFSFNNHRRFKMNIRQFTKFAFVLAIIALIVGLSVYNQIGQLLVAAPPEMEDVEREIPIGVVLAQTGPFASPYGLSMLDGFELAREQINKLGILGNTKITFIVEDDQSVNAVEAVNKLVHQDGVSAIVGFAISTQLEQVIPIAQENRVIIVSSVSSAPGLSARGDFIFRSGLNSGVLNPAAVKATQTKYGYQRAATIYHHRDTYSTRSDEAFRAALVESGVKIVTTEIYEGDDTDFSAQLTRIMKLNPDVLFVSALGSHIPPILIQARALMPAIHLIVPELTSIEVEAAGAAAEGAVTSIGWLSTADTPMNQVFVQSYIRRYGKEPSAWAAQSHAAYHILAVAIANAQSVNANAIRDALAKTTGLNTVLGKFSFDPDGEAVYDPIVLTVKNGQFEIFE